jgi:carbon storage regulator CsrA
MLVLSRGAGEKLVFPTIGVTLEVLQIRGRKVRLGIQAPPEVPVLRDELVEDSQRAAAATAARRLAALGRAGLPHDVRNRLHAASLALRLYQRQLDRCMFDAAEDTLSKLAEQFAALELEAAKAAEAATAGPGDPIGTGSTLCGRALLVEDDSNECELLAGFLRISGYEVATAGDGADALDYLASHQRPDVVLLDMFMPRFDGQQTVQAIRSDPRLEDLKVFAISGTSPAKLGIATGPTGVDRWFAKPVNPETLVREMSRELGARRPR